MNIIGVSLRVAVKRSLRVNEISIRRNLASMATSRTIHITPENTGLWEIQQNEPAAKQATEILQEDLEVGL